MKSVAGWIITGKLNKENFGSSERKDGHWMEIDIMATFSVAYEKCLISVAGWPCRGQWFTRTRAAVRGRFIALNVFLRCVAIKIAF